MAEAVTPQKTDPDREAKLRVLLHELGNSLEVILYASDLMEQAALDPQGREWSSKLSLAARKAVAINHELHDLIR